MMGEFVFRNLFHRAVRTLIGVLAIAVEVTLVVIIVGLTSGLLQETAKRIEGIGADVMMQSPSAQIFLAFSGSPMPIKIADKIRELKYVHAVAPALPHDRIAPIILAAAMLAMDRILTEKPGVR